MTLSWHVPSGWDVAIPAAMIGCGRIMLWSAGDGTLGTEACWRGFESSSGASTLQVPDQTLPVISGSLRVTLSLCFAWAVSNRDKGVIHDYSARQLWLTAFVISHSNPWKRTPSNRLQPCEQRTKIFCRVVGNVPTRNGCKNPNAFSIFVLMGEVELTHFCHWMTPETFFCGDLKW